METKITMEQLKGEVIAELEKASIKVVGDEYNGFKDLARILNKFDKYVEKYNAEVKRINERYADKIKEHPTYQAGVLASMLNVHSWSNIADIQLATGKEATLEDYISFDNSIRGLPYQMREYNKQSESALQKHFYKL